MALIAPPLVALAGGAGQVATVAYGAVTVDSAAREGARVASESPNKSLDFVVTLGVTTYTCGQSPSDALTESAVCDAVRSASGLLSASGLTITVTETSTISRLPSPPNLAGKKTCPGGALESGTVSGLPSGTVATMSSPTKATSGTVTTDSSGKYSICLSTPSGSQSQATAITATAVDSQGCAFSTSLSLTVTPSGTVTPSPGNMTLPVTGVCPSPAPTPTAAPTPTPTATATSTAPLPTPPPAATCSTVVADTSYVSIAVSYKVPVFAPFITRFFEDSPGSGQRTVTGTERMQIEPCAVTQGA